MTDADDHDIMDVAVGPDDPATDVPVETLRSGLRSDDGSVRLHAANVASFVPAEEADRLEAVAPELLSLLSEDEQEVTIYQSLIALSTLSAESPAALEDGTPRLVELLGHEMSLIRSVAAHCLANVAMERPEYVASEAETLVAVTVEEPEDAVSRDAIENPDLERQQRESLQAIDFEEGVRQQVSRDVAANLLVEVADHDPALVTPHLDALVDVLESGPLSVKKAVADVIAQIAREDPTAVTAAVDPLCDMLEGDHESLVATAITALGFIGDPEAVAPLRALAEDEDRNEDLRDLARETAAFIEN